MNAHFEAAPALDEDLAHMDQEFAADEGKPINGAAPAFGITWVRDLVPNLQCRDLIKDILPGHGIGEVHADSSGGKTAIVIDMMMHLAVVSTNVVQVNEHWAPSCSSVTGPAGRRKDPANAPDAGHLHRAGGARRDRQPGDSRSGRAGR
jgi:hypothetical protein